MPESCGRNQLKTRPPTQGASACRQRCVAPRYRGTGAVCFRGFHACYVGAGEGACSACIETAPCFAQARATRGSLSCHLTLLLPARTYPMPSNPLRARETEAMLEQRATELNPSKHRLYIPGRKVAGDSSKRGLQLNVRARASTASPRAPLARGGGGVFFCGFHTCYVGVGEGAYSA